MREAKQNGRVVAIDGLRGFCALYVLIFHQMATAKTGIAIVDKLIGQGFTAVPLFFTISGFLLYPRLSTNSDRQGRIEFYIRRAFRILPLWWVVLGIWAVACGFSTRVFLANFFLLFGFVAYDATFIPITPAWSLFVEEWFYIPLPFYIRAFRKPIDVVLLCLASIVFCHIWWQFAPRLGVPTERHFVGLFPFSFFQYFFTGIAISFAFENWDLGTKLQTYVRSWRAQALGTIALIYFFLPMFNVWFSPETACGLFLLAALSQHTFLSYLLRFRPLCRIGRHCYFMYIGQSTVELLTAGLKYRFSLWFGLSGDKLQMAWLPIYILLMIASAEVSWAVWERPWQRVGGWLIKRNLGRSDAREVRPLGRVTSASELCIGP